MGGRHHGPAARESRVRPGCAVLLLLGPRGGIGGTDGWLLLRPGVRRRIACPSRATPLLLELACDSALFLLFLCQAVVGFGHWDSLISLCSADVFASLFYSDSTEVPAEYSLRAILTIGTITHHGAGECRAKTVRSPDRRPPRLLAVMRAGACGASLGRIARREFRARLRAARFAPPAAARRTWHCPANRHPC